MRFKSVVTSFLSLSLVLQSSTLKAFDRSAARGGDTIQLPELKETQMESGSATDFISALAFSFGFPGVTGEATTEKMMEAGSLKIFPGKELVGFESQIGKDFITGSGSFSHLKSKPSQRVLIVSRYGFDNPLAVELMKMAKDNKLFAGILITDSGNSIDSSKVTFVESENISSNLKPEALSKGKQGQALQALLDIVYKMVTPHSHAKKKTDALIEKGDFYFAMNGLGNKADSVRDPLMHEKSMIMVELIDENKGFTLDNIDAIYVTDGTNNWTKNPHYNRFKAYHQKRSKTDKLKDGPAVVAVEHVLKLLESFTRIGSSASIADVESVGRQRYNYPDGTFWEVAYTDGKYELNERMTLRYNEMAQDPNIVVNRVVRNHFVQTNLRQIVAEADLHAKQIELHKNAFTIEGMVDAKFVGKESWGVTAAQAGYRVKTPFGQNRPALPKEYSNSINLQMYFEPVRDKKGNLKTNVDPDGIPSDRVLDHDKLTMIEWYDNRKPSEVWVDILIGSYNNSNNRYNAERQDFIRVRKDSEFYSSLYHHVMENAKLAEKEGRSINLKDGIFIKELALFLGHEPNDVDWKKVIAFKKEFQKEISQLLRSEKPDFEQFQKLGERLKDIVPQTPSRLILSLQVTPEALDRNLKALFGFFKWYTALPRFHQGFQAEISADELLTLGSSLLRHPKDAKMALIDILWTPVTPRHILDARAYRAYEKMNLKDLFISKGIEPAQAEFPFLGSPFNISQVGSDDIREWLKIFNQKSAKSLDTLAGLISKWAHAIARKTKDQQNSAEAATKAEILTRLGQFKESLQWYDKLPVLNERNSVDLKHDEIVQQFFLESSDLLVNADKNEIL